MIFPGTPAAIQVYSVAPTEQSISQGLEADTRTDDRQRWGLRLAMPGAQRAEWATAFSFLVGQAGRYETFTIVPAGIDGRGILTGTPTVSGSSQTGRTLTTAGWTVSQTDIVKAGDFFSLENKVYMATADSNSDGDGDTELTIDPALVSSPAHGATLTVASVPFLVTLIDDSLEGSYDRQGLYSLAFDVIETI